MKVKPSTARNCKYYIIGGHCSHNDAPCPNHSWCIGERVCGSFEHSIRRMSTEEIKQELREGKEKMTIFKYKLVLVEECTLQPAGSKYPLTTYREECVIGYFDSEKSLERWAKENDGELAKN